MSMHDDFATTPLSDLIPASDLHFPSRSGLSAAFGALFDRGLALLALITLLPLFLMTMALIFLMEGRPLFYAQTRVGKGGRPFRCYKFRTMARDAEARLSRMLAADPVLRAEWEQSHKLARDPRVSCLGAVLRKTSLDELPQFWNVLKGDMSLVGPRPITAAEMVLYGPHIAAYLSLRPGLTGLWQISGRSGTSYADRVALDVRYCLTRSFRMDLGILLRTVRVVLTGHGAC